MRISFLFVSLLYLNTVRAFRANSNQSKNHNTHSPCGINRNKSVNLFDSCDKSISKCPVYNSLASKVSFLNKKVKDLVPGGWYTAVTVPLATLAAYKWFSGRKSNARVNNNLHRYQCTGCGFVIFPAKNREEKFFSEVEFYLPQLRGSQDQVY
ncbi:hypothetical protein MACK_003793 [Theileria orientalis]|uniref:Uncharacterized protein n=1 Tax=Theileria orientalis TaxID=68886 RepID=A0A976SIX1_THEOR|nr:hypothetical protein MACK_003793 [Theileria orientalis]